MDNTADHRRKPRPGGRSARVQEAVHQAVRELQQEQTQNSVHITVPTIAERAGVTPSTIYRRWGSLAQLLSDVAIEKMQPDILPKDTGNMETDLKVWFEQFLEEMSSEPGRAMIRDVISGNGSHNCNKCCNYTSEHLDYIHDKAIARGETPPSTTMLLDRVVAPMMYRIWFTPELPEITYIFKLLDEVLQETKSLSTD